MNPNEVIEQLRELGVNISRKTLYNWEQWGLISEPTFRNSRVSDYPQETPFEAFASWYMLNNEPKVSPERLKDVRAIAIQSRFPSFAGASMDMLDMHFQAVKWRALKLFAENGFHHDVKYIYFADPPEEDSQIDLRLACNDQRGDICLYEDECSYNVNLRDRILEGSLPQKCPRFIKCLAFARKINAVGYVTYRKHKWNLVIKARNLETKQWFTHSTYEF